MKINDKAKAVITDMMTQRNSVDAQIQQYIKGLADGMDVDISKYRLDLQKWEFVKLEEQEEGKKKKGAK